MKTKELREKKITELNKILEDERKNLQKLNFDVDTKKLKNNQEIKNTRKNIARILTILTEKEFISKGEANE